MISIQAVTLLLVRPLTTDIDHIVGTPGNDIIIGGAAAGGVTLNPGDQINGMGGVNTLKIYNAAATNNNANFGLATIANVQNVETTLADAAQALNVSLNTGVQAVTIVGGVGASGGNGITANLAQTVGFSGDIDTAAGNTLVTYRLAGGAADAGSIVLSNADLTVGAATRGIAIANIETLNIAATGVNDLGTGLTIDEATRLNITGDGDVDNITMANSSDTVQTIAAGTATGDLYIDNRAAVAGNQSVTTGSGDDVYTTTYAPLTAQDSINLGTGVNALLFSDAATFNSAATAGLLAGVSNVQVLGTQNALLTIDGDNVTQTSFYTNGNNGDVALTDLSQGSTVTFGPGDILASAVATELGANTLNIVLEGDDTNEANVTAGAAGLTSTGTATLNVNSIGVAGVAANALEVNAADNQVISVTGSQNLTLTAIAATGTIGFGINAATFTGRLNATGTLATDLITGGLGRDTLFGGAGATVQDTLTGGAAADIFSILAGVATAAENDIITDFVSGADQIQFNGNGAAATAVNYSEAIAAVGTYALALAAADAAFTADTDLRYNVQQVGADSYVFFDVAGGGTPDHAVKLTGVALTGVAFTDIIAA